MNIVIKRLDPDRVAEGLAQMGGAPDDLREWLAEIDARYAPPGGCFLLAADWNPPPGEPLLLAASGAFRRISPEICEVRRLLVKKAFQGHGLGKLMMRALTDQARAAGYTRMRAEAPAAIPALVSFYKREGFKEVSAFRVATLEELEGRVFLERPL
ncbi:MAG TPA: GNAT family N-acetyltransferase [Phycisphaerae bacterium]|jgi:GNAT superfamily N-acetyltransferase|nr:GNAT family N-acetyltransferase [Phycisphaerae bacterium]